VDDKIGHGSTSTIVAPGDLGNVLTVRCGYRNWRENRLKNGKRPVSSMPRYYKSKERADTGIG
jgi:hypothetical protein